MRNLITLAEAATLTGYQLATIYAYQSAGRFVKPRQRIGRAGLYAKSDVREWMRLNRKRGGYYARRGRGRKRRGV
jgi:predicted DNA-binding transcriptional regulator AlpA